MTTAWNARRRVCIGVPLQGLHAALKQQARASGGGGGRREGRRRGAGAGRTASSRGRPELGVPTGSDSRYRFAMTFVMS